MMRARWPAIALAAAAIALTPVALAQVDVPAAAPSSAASPEGGTPLALRPSKPLELAHEPPHSGIGWKLAAIVAVLGGAAFYVRKKWTPSASHDAQLTIVRRATVGFRSELLVVNVEGQRLLLGVTPQSIQSLAILDNDEAPAAAAAPVDAAGSASTGSLGERFAAMLDAADRPSPRARGAKKEHAQKETLPKEPAAKASRLDSSVDDDEPEIGSQARGLLALRRPR